MLRLTLITLAGLWAAFMTFGRDLSPEEYAAYQARNDARVPAMTQVSETFAAAFGNDDKRRGAYVPTLAELDKQEALMPSRAETAGSSQIILASASLPNTATTQVSHPEKLMAALAVDPKPEAQPEQILREVTATRVNVRSGPSTAFGVMGQVVRAEIVQVASPVENGWVKIVVEGDGVEGYMAAKFLTELSH